MPITHAYVSPINTAAAETAGKISGNRWNEEHDLSGLVAADITDLGALATVTPGTGIATALAVNVGTDGAPVIKGGALGTPASGTLTNATGLPEAGLTLADNTTNNVSTTKHGFAPKAPNDSSKFLDGTGAWSTPAGGATPGGADTQIQFNDGGSALGGDSAFTWDKTNNVLTIAQGTITTNQPQLFTSTWNASGVTFTGWKINITNTASASGSLIVDFQVGGSSMFSVGKAGSLTFGAGQHPTIGDGQTQIVFGPFNAEMQICGSSTAVSNYYFENPKFRVRSDGGVHFSSTTSAGGTIDLSVVRDAAGVLGIKDGSTNLRDVKLRNLLAGGGNGSYIQTPSMTVANLAAASTAGAGARAFVTDATATTFLSTVSGGGSNKVPVVSDGTNWLIG